MEAIKKFMGNHPQISAWIALTVGMVAILFWSIRDLGFNNSQLTALVVTTILLAGACVWIISWEDDEDEDELIQEQTETITVAEQSNIE